MYWEHQAENVVHDLTVSLCSQKELQAVQELVVLWALLVSPIVRAYTSYVW